MLRATTECRSLADVEQGAAAKDRAAGFVVAALYLVEQKAERAHGATVGAEHGALLSGMVLGGSGRLDEETRELFTDNGLAHLLLFRVRILCS